MSQANHASRVESAVENKIKEIEAKQREIEFQKKKESFNTKIDDLADRVIEYTQNPQYGPDHYITRLMKNCLNIVIRVKELTENLVAIHGAMDTVTHAIGLIDDLVNMDSEQMTGLIGHEYAPTSRFKAWLAARKARVNQRRRMKMVIGGIKNKIYMANTMIKSMDKMAVDLEKMFNSGMKNNDPNARTPADDYLANRAAATGTTFNGGSGSGASAPTAPTGGAPSAPPSGSTGIDGL